MNIYRVWRTDDVNYDEYDSAVVVAKNEEQARELCPFNASNTEIVKVEIINKKVVGIVCASFNAG